MAKKIWNRLYGFSFIYLFNAFIYPLIHLALGLDLYEFLAPDAYSRLSEYVALIDKTTMSTVYDVRFLVCFNC